MVQALIEASKTLLELPGKGQMAGGGTSLTAPGPSVPTSSGQLHPLKEQQPSSLHVMGTVVGTRDTTVKPLSSGWPPSVQCSGTWGQTTRCIRGAQAIRQRRRGARVQPR